MKRAQTLKRLVTLSTEEAEEEEEEEESPSVDERHSICDLSTFGMLTKPSSVAPKQPPNLLGSSCGDPANGSPPQAWKSAPSWQRVKVVVELSEEEEDLAVVAVVGGESELRSRGPLLHPAEPPSGAK